MATSVKCSTGTTPITSPRDFRKGLEQMFKAKTKTNRLFEVDGAKIGVIFNPHEERVKIGIEYSFYDKVILVCNEGTPDKGLRKIKEAIPKEYSTIELCDGNYINGKPIFQMVKWE